MRKLLEIFIKAIIQRIVSEFGIDELWDPNNIQTKQKLVEMLKVSRLWKDKLVEIQGLWRESKENQWKNDIDLSILMNFTTRLAEILEIRNQFDELSKLFGNNLSNKINISELFSPLKGISALNIGNEGGNWNSARNQFIKYLEPLEGEMQSLLRNAVFSTKDLSISPFQTLKEMSKWQGLLARNNVITGLANERNILLVNL